MKLEYADEVAQLRMRKIADKGRMRRKRVGEDK